MAVGELGDGECTGGMVGAGEAKTGFFGEVVVAGVVEESQVVDGGGGNDLGDFALYDLAGLGFGGLLGDGDALVGADEFGDVTLGGVVGNATHGDVVPLGQGDVEDPGGVFGIVEEHFVKVTKSVKEKNVIGQRSPHGHVLSHHRGELFLSCHRGAYLRERERWGEWRNEEKEQSSKMPG